MRITFDAGQLNTRAFFDNTSLAEPYEKEITKMDIYVVDDQGKQVMHKRFDANEITKLKGGLYVPVYCEGRYCTFYAVANHYRYLYFNGETALVKANDDNNTHYTGNFNYISTYSRQYNGFTMSDVKKVLIGPNGTVTDVSFTLKRTVAKIAIRTEMTPDFPARYHTAKAWIKSVELTNCPTHTPLWYQPGVDRVADGWVKVTQDAEQLDGYSCNLLYVFENFARSAGGRECNLVFTIVLDMDGSSETHDDRIEAVCTVPFAGSGDGEIKRNGYYRVQAIIRDFDAIEVISVVQTGDWEPPVTQIIDDLR